MTHVAQSTIAQAVYASSQGCNFARIVTELESLLSRLRHAALRTRWDYDDVVIYDIGETRIILAWSDNRADGTPACLLVSVGPLPPADSTATDPLHEVLCSRLIERIQRRFPPEAVLWRQLPLAIEAELVDALIDSLPPLREALPRGWAATLASRAAALLGPANDLPDLPHPDTARLAGVRAALYAAADETPAETAQMRLAAQAMNATLIMVWAPLGAAVMTYSLLKGKNFAFSARMMAVGGTLFGVTQAPVTQFLTALAGA